MKNLQKSFVVPLLIAVAVVVIGGGVYAYTKYLSLQVTRIYADTNNSIVGTDLAKASELFLKNNIDVSKVAIVSFSTDRFGKVHVGCKQFYKDLRFIDGNLTYHFNETGKVMDRSTIDGSTDILTSGGNPIGDIVISDKPGITMHDAASKVSAKMKSRSFTAELGFKDLNAGTSNTERNFALVWRIMPKNAQVFPYAEINAQDGTVLHYDDGMRY